MLELYKCNICGQMIMVVVNGDGTLVCCNQPMTLIQEKQGQDEGKEKHVPVVVKTEKGTQVKVGSVPHPMVEDHFIECIQVIGDTFTQTHNLKPGDAPEKEFCVPCNEVKKVRIFCNKHGFWNNL